MLIREKTDTWRQDEEIRMINEKLDFYVMEAYIPGEILPTHKFYDYDAKYSDPSGADLIIPADLSQDLIETIRATAVKAYCALDCSGLSRVDFFIDKGCNCDFV